MADGVEVLPLFKDSLEVEVGEDQLFASDDRFDDPLAVRARDAGAAVVEDVLAGGTHAIAFGQVGGEVFRADDVAGGEDVAAHFLGDEGRDLAGESFAAGPEHDVQVFTGGVEGGAREGHPVFPAVERADGEAADLVGDKAGAVAGPPRQAFFVGRHEFAMDGQDGAGGVDDDARAVDGVSVALGEADDGGAVRFRSRGL